MIRDSKHKRGRNRSPQGLHNGQRQCLAMLQARKDKTMTATITMSLPYVTRHAPVSFTATADDKVPLYAKLADAIRRYAARQGVSPRAVEYAIRYA